MLSYACYVIIERLFSSAVSKYKLFANSSYWTTFNWLVSLMKYILIIIKWVLFNAIIYHNVLGLKDVKKHIFYNNLNTSLYIIINKYSKRTSSLYNGNSTLKLNNYNIGPYYV